MKRKTKRTQKEEALAQKIQIVKTKAISEIPRIAKKNEPMLHIQHSIKNSRQDLQDKKCDQIKKRKWKTQSPMIVKR